MSSPILISPIIFVQADLSEKFSLILLCTVGEPLATLLVRTAGGR